MKNKTFCAVRNVNKLITKPVSNMATSHFSVCLRQWKSTLFLNWASAARYRSRDHSESRRNSSAWWAGAERRHHFRSPSFRASFGELAGGKPPVTQRHTCWININHTVLDLLPSLPKKRNKQAAWQARQQVYTLGKDRAFTKSSTF